MTESLERLARFDPLAGLEELRGPAASVPYVLVDVFTETPLQGNQLAVFTDARRVPEGEMQRLARELNLAETVFVLAPEQGATARIRIFTPLRELPFAGHPVLGSAIVLASALRCEEVTLETGAGPIAVRVRTEGELAVSGWMRQPLPSWEPFERADELLAALRVERSELPVEAYRNGPRHAYVALEGAAALSRLRPDMDALAELGEVGANCFAGSGRHWRTRMFAPALGVPEDAATGSAAGPLAVHLARHGRIAFGEEIEISQGSEVGRPSLLRAIASGTREALEQVEVGGSAVMVARGQFRVGG